jgi:hypothetical protein
MRAVTRAPPPETEFGLPLDELKLTLLSQPVPKIAATDVTPS